MSSVLERPVATVATETELLVIWQQPTTRAMIPVGVLGFDGETYTFAYLPNAADIAEFRPLLGFRDFTQSYTSDELFPLFRERVLDPTRPDFSRVIDELSLDPVSATPWEQLVRSGGGSEGDTLQVIPFPRESDGGWACTALVAGMRYLSKKSVRTATGVVQAYADGEIEDVLRRLAPGQELKIVSEVGNDYNPDAQLLFTDKDELIGYVPDWIAKLMAPALTAGASGRAIVERVNGAAAGWHLRVLVNLQLDEAFDGVRDRIVATTQSY